MGEVQSPPAAGSLARARRLASPCRWLLLGRGGQWGKSKVFRLWVHLPGGDGCWGSSMAVCLPRELERESTKAGRLPCSANCVQCHIFQTWSLRIFIHTACLPVVANIQGCRCRKVCFGVASVTCFAALLKEPPHAVFRCGAESCAPLELFLQMGDAFKGGAGGGGLDRTGLEEWSSRGSLRQGCIKLTKLFWWGWEALVGEGHSSEAGIIDHEPSIIA